jgi:hypothetical protein
MMGKVFYFVQLIGLIQLGAMLIAVFLFYLTRVLLIANDRRLNRVIKKINQLLFKLSANKAELSAATIHFLKKNLRELLQCMIELESKPSLLPNWSHIQSQLSVQVLNPKAKRLARSSRWFNQYLAVLCYQYSTSAESEDVLSSLVYSDTFLVSLTCAKIIFKYPTAKSVNALIDAISKNRHTAQSLFVEAFSIDDQNANQTLAHLFTHRLNDEKNPYIKAFCYRILMRLASPNEPPQSLENDRLSHTLELKLAAIRYLAYVLPQKRSTLRQCLDDPQLEVRAVAAKLLGELHDETAIPLLEARLGDPAWWVRMNSAQALAQIGEKGIKVLKKQSPTKDQFAFESAQYILIALENSKEA